MSNVLVITRFLVACVGLAAMSAHAQTITVEYVLDVADPSVFAEPQPGEIPLLQNRVGTYRLRGEHRGFALGASVYPLQLPADILDPLGLSTFTVDASLQRKIVGGSYPVVGLLDFQYRHSLLRGDTYGRAHGLAIGPQISFTPRTSTRLYYRYGRDAFTDELLGASVMPLWDADIAGAGLAQTWHFANRKGQVRLGYEIKETRAVSEDVRMEGQRLNVSGRIPLVPGLDARFEADYSWNRYPEYQGLLDLESYRREFRAGLSGRLSENLQANINYGYAGEDSDADFLSYRRQVWGLNFRYTY